jgi:nucleoid DNA-binding protein
MADTIIETITRENLIALAAAEAGLTVVAARRLIDAYEVNQVKKLKMGKSVRTGLYKISTYQRAAYNGMNPKTRVPVLVKPKVMVKFQAIQSLIDAVN